MLPLKHSAMRVGDAQSTNLVMVRSFTSALPVPAPVVPEWPDAGWARPQLHDNTLILRHVAWVVLTLRQLTPPTMVPILRVALVAIFLILARFLWFKLLLMVTEITPPCGGEL